MTHSSLMRWQKDWQLWPEESHSTSWDGCAGTFPPAIPPACSGSSATPCWNTNSKLGHCVMRRSPCATIDHHTLDPSAPPAAHKRLSPNPCAKNASADPRKTHGTSAASSGSDRNSSSRPSRPKPAWCDDPTSGTDGKKQPPPRMHDNAAGTTPVATAKVNVAI